MIGRIERQAFIPSIAQLEALSAVLDFDLTDMFVENEVKFICCTTKRGTE